MLPYWVFAEIEWDIKMLAGEPEEAVEILTESYEHVERMGGFPLESAWLAQSLYAVGRFEDAERRAQAAVDAVDDDLGRCRRAGCARAGPGAARTRGRGGADGERGGRLLRANRLLDRPHLVVLMDLAEVLRLAGRPEEAIATHPRGDRSLRTDGKMSCRLPARGT